MKRFFSLAILFLALSFSHLAFAGTVVKSGKGYICKIPGQDPVAYEPYGRVPTQAEQRKCALFKIHKASKAASFAKLAKAVGGLREQESTAARNLNSAKNNYNRQRATYQRALRSFQAAQRLYQLRLQQLRSIQHKKATLTRKLKGLSK